MKNMKFKLMILALTVVASVGAQAYVMKHIESAGLTDIRLDPAFGDRFGATMKLHGNLLVNYSDSIAQLNVSAAPNCPPNAMCAQFLVSVLNVDLKIESIEKGACGEIIVTAREDRRPVDGLLETLRIVDNRHNFCETLIALPATEVTYETESLRGEKTQSEFRAKSLELMMM